MKKLLCAVLAAVTLLCGCSAKSENNALKPQLQRFSPPPVNLKAETLISSETKKPAETVTPSASVNGYVPINYEEQKAVWFSYIDIADMLTNRSEEQFRSSVSEAFDNVCKLGCNTVYVHVRPFGDALYKSDYYPQSRYYNGNMGQNSGYDALEIVVSEGHKKGLSVHAWINPLRCEKPENIEKINDSFLIKKWYDSEEYYGKYLVSVKESEQLWLNPAYEEVRNLICNGVEEICRNYEVDGIHIDDYFYPTVEESFDKQAFSQSETASVSDFRMENTSLLVSEIYKTVKKVNSRVLFGISPQGNIQNNYQLLFADVKKWAGEKGYCDYIAPQLYFGFENPYQPFSEVASEWDGLVCGDVKLVFGLAFYKIHEEGEFSENSGIIAEQIETVKKLPGYGGVALYNYKNIFPQDKSLENKAEKEAEQVFSALK